MVSRKTYFGIGLPKDLPDAARDLSSERDPEDDSGKASESDNSAPTVIDDEKVAEGLQQLRRWYQADSPPENGASNDAANFASNDAAGFASNDAAGVASTATPLGEVQNRLTAVGHATGAPPAIQPRPMAPDPMRATMYGHDIHRFVIEAPAEGDATAPVTTTALVLAEEEARIQKTSPPAGVPLAVGRSHSDGFQLASFGNGEAQRLQRPPNIRRSSIDHRPAPTPRQTLASRIMLAVGLASLTVALLVSLRSHGDDADLPAPVARPVPAAHPAPIALPAPVAPQASPPRLVPAERSAERAWPPVNGDGQLTSSAARAAAPAPLPAMRSPRGAPVAAGRTPTLAASPKGAPTARETGVGERAVGDETGAAAAGAEKVMSEPDSGAGTLEVIPPPSRGAPARRKADGARAAEGAARKRFDPTAGDEDATLPPSDE